MDNTNEIHDLIKQLAALKARKHRPGTRIYYLEKRLERLKAEKTAQIERKTLPQKRSPRKRKKAAPTVGSLQNRAYVLSCESHDLTQALVALEMLRKGHSNEEDT